MRDRTKTGSDSLDMLLDTICNTFGGILFVAILVVLMIRSSATVVDLDTPIDATPDEIESLRLELKRQQSELESLEMASLSQARLVEGFAPEEIQELLKTRNDLQEQKIDLQKQKHQEIDQNAELSQENEARRESLETSAIRHEELLAEVASLEKQLDEAIDQRSESHSLPVVRSNLSKNEVGVILKYGRMYVWHRYNEYGFREGLNTDDFVVLENKGGRLLTAPLPTAGIKIGYGEETRNEIRRALSKFDPSRSVIAAVVRTDSFKEFRILRNVLKDMGFGYRLMPGDSLISDRGGTGGRYQ